MRTTFEECKECKKHWFHGTGIEMCDNDWNCLEHEELHRAKDVCTITWHPYPKDKPIEKCFYLITEQKGRDVVSTTAYWRGTEWSFSPKVIAWAELPKPYKEEE